MIYLKYKHADEILNILSKYPFQFYAFGSRVKGNFSKFSDLDLCYKENIPWQIISEIEEFFDLSDIPFKVDLVDLSKADPVFKSLIEKDLVLFKKDNISNID